MPDWLGNWQFLKGSVMPSEKCALSSSMTCCKWGWVAIFLNDSEIGLALNFFFN